jgi:hypothetical protein
MIQILPEVLAASNVTKNLVCPRIMHYQTETIMTVLKSSRPKALKRLNINKDILWDLVDLTEVNGVPVKTKYMGNRLWTKNALDQYLSNRGTLKTKGLQSEHNNERIYYTNRLLELDPNSKNLEAEIKEILGTTVCTIVTGDEHKKLTPRVTDVKDPFIRYRELDPIIYYITWNTQTRGKGKWKIESVNVVDINI